jgi:hypothetical protein
VPVPLTAHLLLYYKIYIVIQTHIRRVSTGKAV